RFGLIAQLTKTDGYEHAPRETGLRAAHVVRGFGASDTPRLVGATARVRLATGNRDVARAACRRTAKTGRLAGARGTRMAGAGRQPLWRGQGQQDPLARKRPSTRGCAASRRRNRYAEPSGRRLSRGIPDRWQARAGANAAH